MTRMNSTRGAVDRLEGLAWKWLKVMLLIIGNLAGVGLMLVGGAAATSIIGFLAAIASFAAIIHLSLRGWQRDG